MLRDKGEGRPCFRLGEMGLAGNLKSDKTWPFYGPERLNAKKWRFSALTSVLRRFVKRYNALPPQ
jgi:hypothetical protein